MGRFNDIAGERYGKLLALHPTEERTRGGGVIWMFRCDCGSEKAIPANSVRSGRINSCGCVARKHGKTKTRLYNIWVDMRQRCTNQSHPQFYLWGGRGISVCSEWQSFDSFYKWAIANGYNDKLSIDRKNSDGNYEPTNCRWATAKEQANNTRSNRYVTINGEQKRLVEWCKHYGISTSTAYRRIREFGLPVEEAITMQRLRREKIQK